MNKEYYHEYYILERNHWWFRVREKIIKDTIKKYVPLYANLKILNIGVATGRSSQMLRQFGEVSSIEYDKECCEFAREMTGLNVINGSILDLPFADNLFDLVCAFDVIEHIEDDLKGVAEMKRVCKSGGIVFVTVPAFQQLWSHHDVVNHHFRRYTMDAILTLFQRSEGLVLFKTYFNSFLFVPIYAFRLISKNIPEKWIRKKAGSDFSVNNNWVVNKTLYMIFSLERLLLRKATFPAGVSIAFLWRNS